MSSALSEQEPVSRRRATRRLFLRLCGSAIGVGVAAPLDARLIEPYVIDVTRHEVYLPNLPLSLDGFQIAHLTDIHRGPITPDSVIQHAVRLTSAIGPDLVALTGDFVDSNPADAGALAAMLAPLAPKHGIWACLGNHDYGGGPNAVADALTNSSAGPIRLLRNASADVAPGLRIAGIEDTLRGKPDTEQALTGIEPQAPLVFLTHNPTGVFSVARRPCLALAGHTHGGQICIPGLPIPMPPGMDGFPMTAGWGVFDRARLYISRGVGMGKAPIRFRCRPEIAVHILRRGDAVPKTLPNLSGRALNKTVRVARRVLRHLS